MHWLFHFAFCIAMFGEIEGDQWWWPLDCEDWIGQRRRRCKAVGSRLHQMYRIIHTDNFQWSPAKGQILFPHKILSRIYTWSRGIWQPSPHCLIYFFRFFVISKWVVSLLVSLNIVVEAVMIRPVFWVDANHNVVLCGQERSHLGCIGPLVIWPTHVSKYIW